MTDTTVLDELAAAVRTDPSGPDLVRLWRAVYGLPQWWLLPTGTVADPRPLVGVVGEQRFLLSFTSQDRVVTFAGGRAGTPAGAGTAAMSITPAELTGLADTLARGGIAGVLFDQGVHDLVAPIMGLRSMWERFGAAA